jgi:hypothetical protein
MQKNNIILWVAAFVITFLVIFLANLLDKEYPISGTFGIENKKVSYRFEKKHFGNDDVKVIIRTEIDSIKGKLFWKNKLKNEWAVVELKDSALLLKANVPAQDPLQTIEYYVELNYDNKKNLLPDNKKVDLIFYGKISPVLNVLRYLLLYVGLFLSIRTGLEYFKNSEKSKKFAIMAVLIFATLALLINPLYLTYKLGYMNKTIPPISNLFPYGFILMTVLWILTVIVLFRFKEIKITSLAAGIISILLFLFTL